MKTLTIDDKVSHKEWANHDCKLSPDSGCQTCEDWYKQSHDNQAQIKITSKDKEIVQKAYEKAKLKYKARHFGDEDAKKNYEAILQMEYEVIKRL